jgi:hypothetical protein
MFLNSDGILPSTIITKQLDKNENDVCVGNNYNIG